MTVDCDRCKVRGNACQDCVITLLFGAPPVGVELDGAKRRTLDTLAEDGMVPRLLRVDRGEDYNETQVTGACAHGCTGGERSATGGERPARYVC
jgi:hypothetical protein